MANQVSLTSRQINSMVSLYNKGSTAMEIAVQFEISVSTTLRYLRENGAKIRSRGRRPNDE